MLFFKYLFIFCLFSFIGWLIELIYRSIMDKRIVNPGFMTGCVVPIYGFSALILNIICGITNNIYLFIPVSIALLTLLELISGIFLDKCFHLRLWDYSNRKFNYKGFICLRFTIYWFILALLFKFFMYSRVHNLSIIFINNNVYLFMLGIFTGIFLLDLCASIDLVSKINKYSKVVKQSINYEKIKFDARRETSKRKFISAIFPYFKTSKYLKDKLSDYDDIRD